YGGHGIGRSMHEDPYLANEGRPGRGPGIQEGSVLAIEPMLSLGTIDTAVLDDDWGVVTVDGSYSSHWEHTVAATAGGPRILTPRHHCAGPLRPCPAVVKAPGHVYDRPMVQVTHPKNGEPRRPHHRSDTRTNSR